MKKYSTIIKSLFALSVAFGLLSGVANAQKSKIEFFDDYITGSFFGHSDNGRYGVIVVGISDDTMYSFLYDKLTGTITELGNSSAVDVSDNGVVAGRFLDKSIKIEGQAIYSGGWWKDGEWHSLGLHPNHNNVDKISSAHGSAGNCITPDGRIVAGYAFLGRKIVPCTWNLKTGEFIEYRTEFNDQNGATPRGLSDDGLTMCGWSYMVGDISTGAWLPCIWKDKNTTITVPKEIAGSAAGFLRAMDSKGTKFGGHWGSNGIVIDIEGNSQLLGYDKWRGMSDPNNMYKQGIMAGTGIWTEENGLMSFDKFMVDIWGLEYDHTAHGGFGIQTISDDGKTFSGVVYTATMQHVPFMITLEGYPLPVAVKNVNVSLTEGTQTVRVTWEKPVYNGYPINGYNVYRNGVKINNKLIKDKMEFADAEAPLGINGYHVTAEYAFDETFTESPAGMIARVEVIDPNGCFSPKGLVADVVYNKTVNINWGVPRPNYDKGGESEKATPVVRGYNLYKNGVKVNTELLKSRSYSEVIVVPGSDPVQYAYEVDAEFENACTSAKSMPVNVTINPIGTCTSVRNLKVEALRGSAVISWSSPASPSPGVKAIGYNLYRNGTKLNSNLLTDLTYTDANLQVGVYEYQVDVFFNNSCESSKSTPVTVDLKSFNPTLPVTYVNITTSAGNKANITWGTPEFGDFKTVRWYNGAVQFLAGRQEGGELWIACLWDEKDLDNYFDYTLTDVEFYSAYNVPHTFYIYVDDQLKSTQVLNNVNANEFNIARLDTPVLIERGKKLKIAYKITNAPGQYIVGADVDKSVDGKGNLMSEDGVNWYNASKDGMVGNWAITGRLVPYSVAATASVDGNREQRTGYYHWYESSVSATPSVAENIELGLSPLIVNDANGSSSFQAPRSLFVNKEVEGYNVYRNGTKINESKITENKYTDVMLTGENNCYEVEALFTNDRKSPKSESVCSYGECLVPQNLVGAKQESEQAFRLNWDVPVQNKAKDIVLRRHNGENSDAIGFPQKVKFYALAKWTPFDMTELGNCRLKAIEVFINKEAEISVVAMQGGKLILQQKMTEMNEGEFNTVVLDQAVHIDPSKELMVGVYVNAQVNMAHIGIDAGPVIRDRGDLISFDGKTFNALCQMSTFSVNWNITAILEESRDQKAEGDERNAEIEIPEISNGDISNINAFKSASDAKKSSKYAITELLVGYNVYRDGSKLNSDYILNNEYVDTGALESGNHEYQVTAFWNTGCESKLSNKVSINGTSVDNVDGEALVIFPNPATAVINIVGDYEMVIIYNVSGKQVMEVSNSSKQLNVSGLNAGIYFIEATDEIGNIYRTKVIIK